MRNHFIILSFNFLLLFIFNIVNTSSQDLNYNFKNLFEETELAKTRINCIIQDNRGYIWFGTQIGLYRYDGYSLLAYLANPADSTAISANNIRDIKEDSKGNLWIATYGGGFNKYDAFNETFSSYTADANKNSIPENNITALAIDKDGIIWLGCRLEGLSRFNPKSESMTLLTRMVFLMPGGRLYQDCFMY